MSSEPQFRILKPVKLVGKCNVMSFAQNTTFELWRSFMSERKVIANAIGTDLYSVEVYGAGFFDRFDPNTDFEKWAAVPVTDFDTVPDSMQTLLIPEGGYAVFQYKGNAADAASFYSDIFTQWLPKSGYILDNRPHFALMGDKYRRDTADSEEEIWIPVRFEKKES